MTDQSFFWVFSPNPKGSFYHWIYWHPFFGAISHLWKASQRGLASAEPVVVKCGEIRAKEPATTQYGTETQFVSETQLCIRRVGWWVGSRVGSRVVPKSRERQDGDATWCNKKKSGGIIDIIGNPRKHLPVWHILWNMGVLPLCTNFVHNGHRGLQMECFLVDRMIGHRGPTFVAKKLWWAVPWRNYNINKHI